MHSCLIYSVWEINVCDISHIPHRISGRSGLPVPIYPLRCISPRSSQFFGLRLKMYWNVKSIKFFLFERVRVVKRIHTLLGGVHRLATVLKEVEEVREEVQEIQDEWKDQEVEKNGRLKVEGEPHTSCMDEMTCATPLSHAVHCE